MPTLADRAISLLREGYESLAERVAGMTDSDLDLQSGAQAWDVAQVLSHLGSGAEIMLATVRQSVAGEAAPDNQAIWDRWNAKSQREKATGFLESNDRLVSELERMDDNTRADVRFELSFLPAPIDLATLTGMRLNEFVLHDWDVRVAFDNDAELSSAASDALLDVLSGPLAFMAGFLGKSGTFAAINVVTSDPERELGLVIDGSVRLGPTPTAATSSFVGPAESFLRMLAGRLPAARTPDSVVVSGGLTLDDLRRIFAGY